MTLQSSGIIALSDVNVELGRAQNNILSLNESAVRTLFGVSSGVISHSNGYGKANRAAISLVVSDISDDFNIFNNRGASYIAGKADIVLVIDSGATIGSTSTANCAIDTGTGWTIGDTITIINNGTIIGKGGTGGRGGAGAGTGGAGSNDAQSGFGGGGALYLRWPVQLDTGVGGIYGGGGGGGGGGGNGSEVQAAGPGGGGGGYLGVGGMRGTYNYQDGLNGGKFLGGQGLGRYEVYANDTTYASGTSGSGGQGAVAGTAGTNWYGYIAPGASGGAPGAAIIKNGNLLTVIAGQSNIHGVIV